MLLTFSGALISSGVSVRRVFVIFISFVFIYLCCFSGENLFLHPSDFLLIPFNVKHF